MQQEYRPPLAPILDIKIDAVACLDVSHPRIPFVSFEYLAGGRTAPASDTAAAGEKFHKYLVLLSFVDPHTSSSRPNRRAGQWGAVPNRLRRDLFRRVASKLGPIGTDPARYMNRFLPLQFSSAQGVDSVQRLKKLRGIIANLSPPAGASPIMLPPPSRPSFLSPARGRGGDPRLHRGKSAAAFGRAAIL